LWAIKEQPRGPQIAIRVVFVIEFVCMATRYCVNVSLSLKPERVDEFLRVIQHDQRETLASEPGARQFEVGRSPTNPNEFFLHEEYDDLAAFQAHTRTTHFQEWNQFVESHPFTAEVRADFYETVPSLQTER
jgi:autoinducer 2-degrading protein